LAINVARPPPRTSQPSTVLQCIPNASRRLVGKDELLGAVRSLVMAGRGLTVGWVVAGVDPGDLAGVQVSGCGPFDSAVGAHADGEAVLGDQRAARSTSSESCPSGSR